MACAMQGMISTNSCKLFLNKPQMEAKKQKKLNLTLFRVRASSSDDADCNVEECAPEKEVGKVSMEWLAGEKTKVVGTFPPSKKGWTGYIEKDTAGQTNIYSVEPAVYVAESAISSGTAGSSSEGAENTLALVGGFALIAIAVASSILLQVGKKTPPPVPTLEYSGPSLSYYISQFKPAEVIQAPVPTETETETKTKTETETATSVEPESSAPEVSQVEVESVDQLETPPSS